MADSATLSANEVQTQSWHTVTNPGEVVQVLEPGVQLCVWQRPFVPAIDTWLASCAALAGTTTLEVLEAGAKPVLETLPSGMQRSLLADDLAMLGELLCDLLGCPACGLRLAHVTRAMCPGWHVDRVTLRMICTYRGPGTQWLANQSVERSNLRDPSVHRGDCVSGTVADVVFLKGAGWPGNESYGAIHRSPELPVSAGVRTVVTLDPLWHD